MSPIDGEKIMHFLRKEILFNKINRMLTEMCLHNQLCLHEHVHASRPLIRWIAYILWIFTNRNEINMRLTIKWWWISTSNFNQIRFIHAAHIHSFCCAQILLWIFQKFFDKSNTFRQCIDIIVHSTEWYCLHTLGSRSIEVIQFDVARDITQMLWLVEAIVNVDQTVETKEEKFN